MVGGGVGGLVVVDLHGLVGLAACFEWKIEMKIGLEDE